MNAQRQRWLNLLLAFCTVFIVAGCDVAGNPTSSNNNTSNNNSSGNNGGLFGSLTPNTGNGGNSGNGGTSSGNNGNGGFFGTGNSGGGNLTLFVTPDDGDTPIVNELKKAHSSIRMVMYLLTETDIINELIAAQNRGVKVRVMLEQHPFGGSGNTNDVYNQLKDAGVDVNWSNPVFALTHQKSFVIDDNTAIITTANATHSAFTKNREYGVIDTIPADVLEVATVFDADWVRQTPDLSHANLVWSNVNSRKVFEQLIDSAKQTLYVECEESQDSDIMGRLAQAAKRGVNVELVTNKPTSTTDGNSQGIATLTRAGGHVHYITRLYMHAKLFVVDNQIGWIGSENISAASLDQNREAGIIMNDPTIVGKLADTFNSDWSNSKASK